MCPIACILQFMSWMRAMLVTSASQLMGYTRSDHLIYPPALPLCLVVALSELHCSIDTASWWCGEPPSCADGSSGPQEFSHVCCAASSCMSPSQTDGLLQKVSPPILYPSLTELLTVLGFSSGRPVSPIDNRSEKSSTTVMTGFSSGTGATSALGTKMSSVSHRGQKSPEAFVSLQLEKVSF